MFIQSKIPTLSKLDVGASITFKARIIQEFRYNEDNCWGAYLVETDSGERISVNGDFIKALAIGLDYELTGTITTYRGNNQVKVEHTKSRQPKTRRGMVAFLKTIKGIKGTAQAIYDEFGADSLRMLREDPEEVANRVQGVKLKLAKRAQDYLLTEVEGEETISALMEFGISVKDAKTLYRAHGVDIVETIQVNPYWLREEVRGFGFGKCERLAENLKFDLRSPLRLKAGALHCLEQAATSGHCFLPGNVLTQETLKLVSRHDYPIIQSDVVAAIQELINERHLILEKDRIFERTMFETEVNACEHLIRLAENEVSYSKELVEKLLSDWLTEHPTVVLEKEQHQAIVEANLDKSGLFILDGPAGSGKTFTLNIIMEIREALLRHQLLEQRLKEFEEAGESVLEEEPTLEIITSMDEDENQPTELSFENNEDSKTQTIQETREALILRLKKASVMNPLYVAPTGRASKVLARATNKPASTVHRALHFDAATHRFKMDEKNKLSEDHIICDETSMLDLDLFYSLIQAIRTGAKVVFLGDIHQLPSIKAGNVLKDLIASQVVKCVSLKAAKRQDAQSDIHLNSLNILRGEMIQNYNQTNNAFFIPLNDPRDIQEELLSQMQMLHQTKQIPLEEIQVLSPMRKGPLGSNMLNYLIQQAFNPKEDLLAVSAVKFESSTGYQGPAETYELFFKTNDKVINIKNDYTRVFYQKNEDGEYEEDESLEGGITNGECGVIAEIVMEQDEDEDKVVKRVIVKFEEGYMKYDLNELDYLLHGYCLTIHKSQGSGWRAILFPAHTSLDRMLENNLIYTAWTRCREYVACIGSEYALSKGIKTFRSTTRYTTLAPRLPYLLNKRCA